MIKSNPLSLFVLLLCTLYQALSCPFDGWTEWYDSDLPSGFCDCETLTVLRRIRPGEICDEPSDIEVRVVDTQEPYDQSEAFTVIGPSFGFICWNRNRRRCENHEVRFCCPDSCPPDSWTSWFNEDSPSGICDCETLSSLKRNRPGQVCEVPTEIEARFVTSQQPFNPTLPNIEASLTSGFVCWNTGQSTCQDYEVRYCCPVPVCPDTMVFSDCVQCTRTCAVRNPTCTDECRRECTCPDNTFLLGALCVIQDDCPAPPVCPDTMVHVDCVGCNRTCDEIGTSKQCNMPCEEGCACPENTFFHEGRCITADFCPDPECPENMIYSECAQCTRSCKEKDYICDIECTPGCACPISTYLFEDRCISEDQCPPDNCKVSVEGLEFRGFANVSKSGTNCQRWDLQTPWAHKYYNVSSSAFTTLESNYCRNPDDDVDGPWCITDTLDKFWEYCDVPICESVVCGGVGVCIQGECAITNNGPECHCFPGYEGALCEIDVNECSQVGLCNFGSCQNLNGSFQCICEVGWTGETCNVEMSSCPESDCHEDATCIDIPGGYDCVCNNGFCGDGYSCVVPNLIPIRGPCPHGQAFTFTFFFQAVPIFLSFPVRFGREYFRSILIHRNGLLYFAEFLDNFRFTNVILQQRLRLICPFWFNFPQSRNGIASWKVYQNKLGLTPSPDDATLSSALERVKSISSSILTPRVVIVVEWTGSTELPEDSNNVGTFQCILASDGGTTLIFFLYDPCNFRLAYLSTVTSSPFIGYINSEGTTSIPIDLFQAGIESNIGVPGVYGYVVSKPLPTFIHQCLEWFDREPPATDWLTTPTACPWTADHCRRDNRWIAAPGNFFTLRNNGFDVSIFNDPGTTCFQPRSLPNFPRFDGVSCCYGTTGTFLLNRSWYQRIQIPLSFTFSLSSLYNNYMEREFTAARNCRLAGPAFWDLFLCRRPRCSTFGYRPIIRRRPLERFHTIGTYSSTHLTLLEGNKSRVSFNVKINNGRGWGDPHIETFLGKQYTFNGLGEYYLVYVPEEFILQARMVQASDSDGNLTQATVISTLVALDTVRSTMVIFELSPTNSNDLLVSINGTMVDLPDEAGREAIFGDLSYLRTIEGHFELRLSDEVTMTVYVAEGILVYLLDLSDELIGNVRGLLGPFIQRSGIIMEETQLLITDRNDFLNGTFDQKKMWVYGQTWRVYQNESLFYYPSGRNWFFYNPDDHIPPFITDLVDALPEDRLQHILEICSDDGGAPLVSCVFDLAVTNRISIALQTRQVAIQIQEDSIFEDNMAPVINYTLPFEEQLRFIVGQSTSQQFAATDENDDEITFSVDSLPGISIDNTTGLLTGNISLLLFDIVLNDTFAQLVVSASDGFVTVREVVQPVLICDCSGNGVCLWDEATRGGSVGIQIVHCMCDNGYSGIYCQEDFDACLGNPCVGECNDLPPSNSSQFICASCPEGLEGDGETCNDVNECSLIPPVCAPFDNCVNSFMTYECVCTEGFRKPVGGKPSDPCVNIDECDPDDPAFSYPCNTGEICSDTVGSFQCVCPFMPVGGICQAQLFTALIATDVNSFNESNFADVLANTLSSLSNIVDVVVTEVLQEQGDNRQTRVNLAINTGDTLVNTFLNLRRAVLSGELKTSPIVDLIVPVHRPISLVCTGEVLPLSKTPTAISGDEFGVETDCKIALTTIAIDTCNIASVQVHASNLVLGGFDRSSIDSECKPITIDTVDQNLLTLFLVEDNSKCDIQAKTKNDMIKYYYSIQSNEVVPNSIIQRFRCLNISATCEYNNSGLAELENAIAPWVKKNIAGRENQEAFFNIEAAVYSDPECLNRIDQGSSTPVVTVLDFVYYKFYLTELADQNFVLQGINCWASPRKDFRSKVGYQIIKDGCPTETSEHVQVLNNFEESYVKFGFSVFLWTNLAENDQEIHIFCQVSVCTEVDDISCGGQACQTFGFTEAYPVYCPGRANISENWKDWMGNPKVATQIRRNNCLKEPCLNRRKRSSKRKKYKTQLVSSPSLGVRTLCDEPGTCEQKCRIDFRTVVCSCYHGYKLGDDKRSCLQRPGKISVVSHLGNSNFNIKSTSNVHERHESSPRIITAASATIFCLSLLLLLFVIYKNFCARKEAYTKLEDKNEK